MTHQVVVAPQPGQPAAAGSPPATGCTVPWPPPERSCCPAGAGLLHLHSETAPEDHLCDAAPMTAMKSDHRPIALLSTGPFARLVHQHDRSIAGILTTQSHSHAMRSMKFASPEIQQ